MGILDSDIGYQIGLLAGGLWAERYRERGEEKNRNQYPPFSELFPPLYADPQNTTSLYQNTAPHNTNAKPYTFQTQLFNNQYRPFQK